jgi:hypothetical protein
LEAIVFHAGKEDVNGFVDRTKRFHQGAEGGLFHRGAAGGDGVFAPAEVEEDSAAGTGFGVGRGVVADEEFQRVGGISLSHEVVMVVGGEGFVGGEDQVAVVEGGGWFLDPEITIGDLAVAPAGDGGTVGIAVEDVAEEKEAGGGFAIAFALLDAGLGRVQAATPGEAPATEMDGNGGVGFYPGILGGGTAVELEGGLPGVPMIRDSHKKGAGLLGDGRGAKMGNEKKKRKKEKQPAHMA